MAIAIDGANGIQLPAGSVSNPALKSTDTDTGIYFTSDIVSVAIDGVEVVRISNTGIQQNGDDLLISSDIGSTVQAYDADTAKYDAVTANFTGTLQNDGSNVLVDTDIGSTVQAYDANTAKLDVEQTFTAQQTFTELKETVFTLATSGTVALNPANGSIQITTLSGNITFTDSLEAGQSLIVHINGGSSYSVGFPTITWVTSSGNTAPTLTAADTLVFWKISTTLYGAYVGSYV